MWGGAGFSEKFNLIFHIYEFEEYLEVGTIAVTTGIIIKSRAFSNSIWRQSGTTVWTKLISNLHSSHSQMLGKFEYGLPAKF